MCHVAIKFGIEDVYRTLGHGFVVLWKCWDSLLVGRNT